MTGAHRIVVPTVEHGVARPLWSVMIPTYNCAVYLRETLASVLMQDPGPERMQIEVVDDCSTSDDPEAVVRELGRGRVRFFRQPQNGGHVRNFETCLLRAQGRLVHVLHGDDRVRDGFYRTLQRPFEAHPELGAAFCRAVLMDERGHAKGLAPLEHPEPGILPNALVRIAAAQPIQTPTIVVRREVYERLGGFDRRMPNCGEDWEMWVRIAAYYPVWYEPEPLAEYRQHAISLTARSLRTGDNIRDVRRAVGIYQCYLPQESRVAVVRQIHEQSAGWALSIASALIKQDQWQGALAQLREALRCSRSRRIVGKAARLLARLLRGRARVILGGMRSVGWRPAP